MQKSLLKNNCFIIIIVLVASVIIGVFISSKDDYFFISFADLSSSLINIALAIFVSYYIGNKLNKSNKIFDLQLEGINKFEIKIEELDQMYSDFLLGKKEPDFFTKLKRQFSQAGEMIELLDNFDYSLEQKKQYNEVKKTFAEYWRKLLDPVSVKTFTIFEKTDQVNIEESKKDIYSAIYRLKLSIFK